MNFVFALCLALTSQCPGGVCYPGPAVQIAPQVVRVVEQPTPYDWHKIKHDGLSFFVWGQKLTDGRVRWNPDSSWNVAEYNRARESAKHVERTVKKPILPRKPRNFGLEISKIGHHGVRYTADSEAARQFVARAKANAEKVPRHSVNAERTHRLYVTVIGTDAEVKSAIEDWKSNAELAGFHGKVWFATYRPDDWQVDPKLGFQTGRPEVVVQKSDGAVIYRSDSYPGAKIIARSLRVADPNYDPSKDPGGSSPVLSPKLDIEVLAAAAGVLLLVLFLPGRKKP